MRMKDSNSKVVAFTIVPHQEDEEQPAEENTVADGNANVDATENTAESVDNASGDTNKDE